MSGHPGCPYLRFETRPGLILHWGESAAAGFDFSETCEGLACAARLPGFVFLLPSHQCSADGRSENKNENAGAGWMTFAPCGIADATLPNEAGNLAAADRVFWIFIACEAQVLDELFTGDESPAARRILGLLRTGTSERECVWLPLDLAVRFAAESIRRCPFAGACRAMALDARCNDLIVAFLSGLAHVCAERVACLPAETRIREAAALLQRQFENPPALAKLAGDAGLSESSLKRGFRRFFGCSVYGYIRRLRVERARRLLESGRVTVLEAASHVGYSNPSHFASAFRAHYGMNPKTFQLTCCGQK